MQKSFLLEGFFMGKQINKIKNMVKMIQCRRRPYETPEAEELEILMEASILSGEIIQNQNGEEDDYGDFD